MCISDAFKDGSSSFLLTSYTLRASDKILIVVGEKIVVIDQQSSRSTVDSAQFSVVLVCIIAWGYWLLAVLCIVSVSVALRVDC